MPGKRTFTAVMLDDDIFYLREDLVFAFEATLRWENGNVPGLRGQLPVVQFRGDGAVALRTREPLVRVKLPPQGVVFVDATRLAGWIGRVIPRAVVPPTGGPMGEVCVECTGEGVVLVEPAGDRDADRVAASPSRADPSRRNRPAAATAAAPAELDEPARARRRRDRRDDRPDSSTTSLIDDSMPCRPIAAAARLAGRRGRVLLHSARDDDGLGRWSFVAAEPSATLIARGRSLVRLDATGRAGAAVHRRSVRRRRGVPRRARLHARRARATARPSRA